MLRFRMLNVLLPGTMGVVERSGGGPEKVVAVAALSLDEASEISTHAGHAPNFLIFDERGQLREIVPNPFANLHEDIGDKVAALLEARHVRLLIAGDFGSHLADALDERGIAHIRDVGLANIAVSAHRKDLP
ncbi:MAG: NifB/NifX family molybdenum-iron cluster-binding protein [Gammaproteobacteria bacterium]|nr:NifB/NifX family molybdenum-iron cluster-binding protein [Gammaproteobacteria bacterium]MDJ0871354.1 NifB/NifX family molybdenum-iron cluster-binding protein [Gammaproteobacteria bacterium]MDJ0893392.1 NifB/NifX family molybdenum-iron cluster-binding protein [Gammaproteobacteria bacterium]